MRTRTKITIFGVISLSVLSCGRVASTSESGNAKKPAERRSQSFDFGKARQGAVVHHAFQVVNDGKDALKVARVQTTCGCTVATVQKNTVVEPGKTLEVPVDLNLHGKHNPIESKIIVNYAGNVIADELIMKGEVSEEYPSVVTLPKIKRGEQPEQVISLATFPGQPPLAVQEITFDSTKFDITSKPGTKDGTVDVVFKPAANAPFGAIMDQVVIKTNDAEAPEKPIAARIHVLKPLEPVQPRLILRPGKEGETVTGVAEFKSTYGEPITNVNAVVTRAKRFEVSVEPDSPADTVRVRVAVKPIEKMKKPYAQATLKVSAKVGENDVDEKMALVYTTDEIEIEKLEEGEGAGTIEEDAGKH